MDVPADALRETWDSVFDKSVELARRVEEHCRQTGERFDVMLVVPRGAYYPVNIVARELGFDALHLLHASVSTYKSGSNQKKPDFELGQMPDPEQIRGKNILIIEEVCDTGQTLKYLYDWLDKAGAELIRTGVLHYKPGQSETGFKPDWAVETTEKWIVYPWEPHEDVGRNSIARNKT